MQQGRNNYSYFYDTGKYLSYITRNYKYYNPSKYKTALPYVYVYMI